MQVTAVALYVFVVVFCVFFVRAVHARSLCSRRVTPADFSACVHSSFASCHFADLLNCLIDLPTTNHTDALTEPRDLSIICQPRSSQCIHQCVDIKEALLQHLTNQLQISKLLYLPSKKKYNIKSRLKATQLQLPNTGRTAGSKK